MLLDTLEMAQQLAGVMPFIFYQDDPGAAAFFATAAPGIALVPQQGETLGERMQRAFTEIFGRGFSEVAIIGSDSPDLPAEYVYEAFTQLEYEHTDVVFGPSSDGGYYLLALKRVWDELFMEIPWSSAAVLAASTERAKDGHLGVALLPSWYDLDTPEELERPALRDELSPAVRTAEFLRRTLLPT
jgi:rSAM/selenodomain-associated transferase 1